MAHIGTVGHYIITDLILACMLATYLVGDVLYQFSRLNSRIPFWYI